MAPDSFPAESLFGIPNGPHLFTEGENKAWSRRGHSRCLLQGSPFKITGQAMWYGNWKKSRCPGWYLCLCGRWVRDRWSCKPFPPSLFTNLPFAVWNENLNLGDNNSWEAGRGVGSRERMRWGEGEKGGGLGGGGRGQTLSCKHYVCH